MMNNLTETKPASLTDLMRVSLTLKRKPELRARLERALPEMDTAHQEALRQTLFDEHEALVRLDKNDTAKVLSSYEKLSISREKERVEHETDEKIAEDVLQEI